MKYRVECQTLVTLEIEAESKEDAINIAGEKIIEECLYNADGIDWGIYAEEMKQCKNCGKHGLYLHSDGVCYDCRPAPF